MEEEVRVLTSTYERAEALMQTVFIEGGLIRKLWPFETDAYRDHLLRLDHQSRHNRFCGGIGDDVIQSYAASTRGPDVVAHGFFVDGVLRVIRPLDRKEAEAAFSIEKPWQSRGVGSALLERTLLCARNRGIRHLHVSCLPHNSRMQELARKFDAEIKCDFDTALGTMENPNPTPISLMQEWAADSHSFAAAYVDYQSRLSRPRAALAMPGPYRVDTADT